MENPFRNKPQNPLAVRSDQGFSAFIAKIGSIFFDATATAMGFTSTSVEKSSV